LTLTGILLLISVGFKKKKKHPEILRSGVTAVFCLHIFQQVAGLRN
jgi:hypothetical protein